MEDAPAPALEQPATGPEEGPPCTHRGMTRPQLESPECKVAAGRPRVSARDGPQHLGRGQVSM